MSEDKDFFVGYGTLPNKDRRFLLKTVPAGLLGLAGAGAFLGGRAASEGGGRWETGTPVTLEGRIGFNPYPVLWHGDNGILLAGIGKKGADAYCRQFEGEEVRATGIAIVREKCTMLGVAENDITFLDEITPPIPETETLGTVRLIGEVLDAQCFMGIMNPGYGRTHRGCATQCIRGGQPVFFSQSLEGGRTGSGKTGCGGIGYLLANDYGEKINEVILGDVAVPVMIEAQLEKIGNLYRLLYTPGNLQRLP